MSSYQIPVKRNNEFSTIFNSLDYDVNALSKSNPVLFNDSQYLPPIRINEMFNVADFNYQYDFINYFIGDNRYVKKNDYRL